MSEITELVNEYKYLKDKISNLNHELENVKHDIHMFLSKNSIDTYENRKIKVTRRKMSKQSISKHNVPIEIWEKYATNSVPYYQLSISNKK